MVATARPGGGWVTFHAGDQDGPELDPEIVAAVARRQEPVVIDDLVALAARSPWTAPPWAMRWAYGTAVRDPGGDVLAVVVVMDRFLRPSTGRDRRVMHHLIRRLAAVLDPLEAAPATPLGAPPGPDRPGRRPGGRTAAAGPEPTKLLRTSEVAALFKVTERTVVNWAVSGKIPSVRTVGGHLRFRASDMTRLLEYG